MNRSRLLLELQTVDRDRDAAIGRLRQVLAALQGDSAVQAAMATMSQAEARLADLGPRLKAVNLERDGLRGHIKDEEAKLYGGRVTSPKELQGLQQEVASLKRRLGELDDVSLELMLERDDAEAEVATAKAAVAVAETDAAARNAALVAEKSDLAGRVRALDADRAQRASGVPPTDLATYEKLRKSKGGVAVAQVRQTECAVCGMQLPRTTLTALHGVDGLCVCPGCGRILAP